jgi:hypothetical protein
MQRSLYEQKLIRELEKRKDALGEIIRDLDIDGTPPALSRNRQVCGLRDHSPL